MSIYKSFRSYLDEGKKYEKIALEELNNRDLPYVFNPNKKGIDLVTLDTLHTSLEFKSDTSRS